MPSPSDPARGAPSLQMLRESEQRFRQIAHAVDIVFWIRTRDQMLYMSDAYEQVWGRSVKALYENINRFGEAAHPEDRARVIAALRNEFDSTDHFDEEYRIVRPDGEIRWIRVVSHPVRDADGQVIRSAGTATDITATKQAQAKLQASQNELHKFFDLSLDFLCIANTQGYFETVNATFKRILGYTEEELIAQSFMHFVHPDDVQSTLYEIEKLSQGQLTLSFINRYRCKNGEYVSLLWNTAPDPATGKLYASALDITQQQRFEQELQDQAEHTQTIVNNIVDGIITIDQAGVIHSFNPAAERIFGITQAEAKGSNISRLMTEPHRGAHHDYIRNYGGNYDATNVARIIGTTREVEGLRQDGSLFPMELAFSEIRRQGFPMYVGMIRDITERKRMERMKSEFVATVSHELRTPLTSISGALGLIASGTLGELSEQTSQMITIAHKNSERLTFLINDLLDMEKLAAGMVHFDLQVQPLMPLITQSLEDNLAYGSNNQVNLVLTQETPGLQVRVDSQRLLQVMSNLISNAIKYSPKQSTVEIRVAARGKWVRIAVTDHGPGIAAAFRGRIFQKFAQSDSSDTRQKGGTGLGLAISKGLVEHMGGAIGFESEPGKGACFYFDLPIQRLDEPSNDQGATEAFEPGSPGGARLLVVEGDQDVAHFLALMLTRAGYAVDIAITGQQALEALARTDYKAMTLDLMLTDINGLEIIYQLRQQVRTLHLPIVVVSAKMEEGRLKWQGNFSNIEWLAKPINQNHLIGTIEKFVGQNR